MKFMILIKLIISSFLISYSFANDHKNLKLEKFFYNNEKNKFPFYLEDGDIYSTFFFNQSKENGEISSLFESLIISYANKTGIRLENSIGYGIDKNLVNSRIVSSKISLLISKNLFIDNNPNFDRINHFFDIVGINKIIEVNGYSAFIPNECGVAIMQDKNENVEFLLLYVDEYASYGEKRSCIEIFSPSMVFVRPMLSENISFHEGANFMPELLASAIGSCRISDQENFDCIREYLISISRILSVWAHKGAE